MLKFLKRLKEGLYQDVPPELQACESCRVVRCTSQRYQTCKVRIQGQAQEEVARSLVRAKKP